jgi:hypothetical protein
MLGRLRDHRTPRDWRRIWRDPAGFFLPNCPCCAANLQAYHVFGGENGSTLNGNHRWLSGSWTAKANMTAGNFAFAGSTPSTTSAGFLYPVPVSSPFRDTLSYLLDAFTTDTSMPSPGREYNAGCAIGGNCYSFGGWNGGTTYYSQNDQLTPGSPSTWATKTAMPDLRGRGGAATIGAKGYHAVGEHLVTGVTAQTRTMYEYNPSGDSWATKMNSPTPARNSPAAFAISGTMYVVDGGPSISIRNDSYVVDTWTTKGTPLGSGIRQSPAGASVEDQGTAWITGYITGAGTRSANHDEYVPDIWTNKTNVATTMEGAVATPIPK